GKTNNQNSKHFQTFSSKIARKSPDDARIARPSGGRHVRFACFSGDLLYGTICFDRIGWTYSLNFFQRASNHRATQR
ncbi:MAG: hypothetical protein WCE50_18095, partial [Candidatus Acidiferrum sp.]